MLQAGSALSWRVSRGYPKSRQVSWSIPPPDQIRGCDFPSALLCARLLQTCLSATWQCLYLLHSHSSSSREFLKLPCTIGSQLSAPATPPRERVTLGRVLAHHFTSSARFPFPQTYDSALAPCSWLLCLGSLSNAAVYKQHPETSHLSAVPGLDSATTSSGLVLVRKKYVL